MRWTPLMITRSVALFLALPGWRAGIGDDGALVGQDGRILHKGRVWVTLVGRQNRHRQPTGPQGGNIGGVLLDGSFIHWFTQVSASQTVD